jgi:uncharacterized repeat protein (TIGR03803 family)
VTARSAHPSPESLTTEPNREIGTSKCPVGAQLYNRKEFDLSMPLFSRIYHRKSSHTGERYRRITACLVLLLFTVPGSAAAQTLTTLVNFDGSNGAYPDLLVQGRDGDVFGTTFGEGPTYCGTVFGLSPAAAFSTMTMSCRVGFLAGNGPQGLVQGTDGNFYGLMFSSGVNELGSVFKLTPKGVLTTLVDFDWNNGAGPVGALTEGKDGNFYGTTESGGDQLGYGTIFKLTPQGVLTTLYQFDFTHGAQPYAGVILASDGNFYGTTLAGGPTGDGTIYKITPQGTLTVVYTFGGNANDPIMPTTALVQGNDSNLYGTTSYGGGPDNYGTIFKLTPAGVFSTLYAFSGIDGYSPGGLVQATDGNYWGNTGYNTAGQGTIFKITPSGALTTVHIFDGADGALPGPVTQSTNGKFYGSTYEGGTSALGTLFSLDTGLRPFVSFVPPLSTGRVGSVIQILGQGFNSRSTVSFNGTPATATVKSSTYLTAVVPSGATTGFVTVTTSGVTLKSNTKFRVIP